MRPLVCLEPLPAPQPVSVRPPWTVPCTPSREAGRLPRRACHPPLPPRRGTLPGAPRREPPRHFPELSSPDTFAAATEALAKARAKRTRSPCAASRWCASSSPARWRRRSPPAPPRPWRRWRPGPACPWTTRRSRSRRGARPAAPRDRTAAAAPCWSGPRATSSGSTAAAMATGARPPLHAAERLGAGLPRPARGRLRHRPRQARRGRRGDAPPHRGRLPRRARLRAEQAGAHLRPLPGGEARRHDLQAALQAPWMDAFFRREDLLPAVTRWLNEWNLHPAAEGRIRLDDEARPGKARAPSSPRCACRTRCASSSSGGRAWTRWAACSTSGPRPAPGPRVGDGCRWSCAGWGTPR